MGMDFLNLQHKLWEEHVAWTRMTIISMAEDLADVDLVTNRLLRNPADIAAAFRPLYGRKSPPDSRVCSPTIW